MFYTSRLLIIVSFTSIWLFGSVCIADKLRVAVASNFVTPMNALARQFESNTSHKIILSPGSTGKHFAQIKNGAPFDVFFAADEHRPLLLEQTGLGIPESRFTYAKGKLVLWSPNQGLIDKGGLSLEKSEFRYLAIANPKLAPYGKAAREVLQNLGYWEKFQKRLVRGENIAQAFNLVKSANAQLGFVAYSQLQQLENKGEYWIVDSSLYEPIKQQAIILIKSPVAMAFMKFVKSADARAIIRHYGYDTSPVN